ncbi:MAG: hypothetical protein R3C05_14420 [Pirellulaceae bacterium]
MNLRLRAQWSSPTPEPVGLLVTIDNGRFENLANLSLDPGSTGAFDLSDDRKQIVVQPRTASLRGGVEFSVEGSENSQVRISMLASEKASSPVSPFAKFTLEEIAKESIRIDLAGGRIPFSIDRSPGDQLRVSFDRETLIFEPGEKVPVSIQPNATGLPAEQRLRLSMTLTQARETKVLFEKQWQVESDADGKVARVDLDEMTLPDSEAAYDLIVRLEPERRYLTLDVPWADAGSTVQRRVQLVVVGKQAAESDTRPFIEFAKIEPTKRQWWNPTWVADRLLPGRLVSDSIGSIVPTRYQPISSDPLTITQWQQSQIAELKPRGWQAYPLQIREPGKPHIMVVRYPNDRSMRLGISIMEPNANGQVIPLGIDSGVSVSPQPIASPPQLLEHRIVFWPKTRQPMIVLTNFDSSKPAWFADLSLEAGPDNLPLEAIPGSTDASSNAQRLAALYLDKPVLADTFGCGKHVDSQTKQVVDDWETFLQAGQRLVEYVKWSGYNGAIITVNSEGAALYPTRSMFPTGRYDMGMFASDGADPSKKDVLELLLRLFDRAGLKMIPAVELATPLAELETALRAGQATEGVEPINSAGHRYIDVHQTEHGLAPYYNPLNPRVRDAMTSVAAELNRRYGHHPSFHGLGIHLGGQTFTAMPGVDWGVDSQTLKTFAASIDNAPKDSRLMHQWIEGEGRKAFVAWRGRRLAGLYSEMSTAIGQRPVVLLMADWLSDASDGSIDSQHAAVQAGLDWESIGGSACVIPLRLHRSEPLADHARQSIDAMLARESLWDNQLASLPSSGAMIMRPPTDVRLRTFESQSPWGEENTQAWLFSHGVPSSDDGLRALSRTLLSTDAMLLAVGGWTIPRGGELSTRDFLQTYCQLPETRFENVAASDTEATQLTIVRRVRSNNAFYMYAMNPAPWAIQLNLEFSNPDGAAITPLHPSSTTTRADAKQSIPLLPGQLIAFRIDSPSADIVTWSSEIPGAPALREHLAGQLQKLSQTVGTLGQPSGYQELANGDFERSASSLDSIPGWLAAQHPAESVKLARDAGVDGSQAVQLTNHGEGARTWLLSHPFPAPTSGRLAIQTRIKRDSKTPLVKLRLALEGRYRDRSIRRSVMITSSANESLPTDWSAMPVGLEVTDLPVEGLDELRIAFDLVSPGTVWIDNVLLHDQFLTQAERKELQSQVFVAVERMRDGDLTAAGRLLDSYWGRYLLGLSNDRLQTADSNPRPPTSELNSPSIADRLRQWLPSPIWR